MEEGGREKDEERGSGEKGGEGGEVKGTDAVITLVVMKTEAKPLRPERLPHLPHRRSSTDSLCAQASDTPQSAFPVSPGFMSTNPYHDVYNSHYTINHQDYSQE